VYATPGQYDVRLTIRSPIGNDTTLQIAYITVTSSPLPVFTYRVNGLTVTFTNTSTNAQNYTWNFGDGQTSTQPSPVHTFARGGVYIVTLNAANAYCARSTTQTIAINLTPTEDLNESGILIFPNPTANVLTIQAEHLPGLLHYHLYNLQGQLLQNGNFIGKTILYLSDLASGMYLLQLQDEEKTWVAKVIRQ